MKFWLLLSLFASPVNAAAAVVRGRLDRTTSSGARVAAGGIAVTVSSKATGRSAPSSTGQDGLYYIHNVRAGAYSLEIWIKGPRNPPRSYVIRVKEPYTDIPAIVVQ